MPQCCPEREARTPWPDAQGWPASQRPGAARAAGRAQDRLCGLPARRGPVGGRARLRAGGRAPRGGAVGRPADQHARHARLRAPARRQVHLQRCAARAPASLRPSRPRPGLSTPQSVPPAARCGRAATRERALCMPLPCCSSGTPVLQPCTRPAAARDSRNLVARHTMAGQRPGAARQAYMPKAAPLPSTNGLLWPRSPRAPTAPTAAELHTAAPTGAGARHSAGMRGARGAQRGLQHDAGQAVAGAPARS